MPSNFSLAQFFLHLPALLHFGAQLFDLNAQLRNFV
tara:strand:+ start:212 stop:319 length:108 start_codon:yes stop_codon:yes gene_type:complete